MVFMLFFSCKDTIKGVIDIRLRVIIEERLHLKAAILPPRFIGLSIFGKTSVLGLRVLDELLF